MCVHVGEIKKPTFLLDETRAKHSLQASGNFHGELRTDKPRGKKLELPSLPPQNKVAFRPTSAHPKFNIGVTA